MMSFQDHLFLFHTVQSTHLDTAPPPERRVLERAFVSVSQRMTIMQYCPTQPLTSHNYCSVNEQLQQEKLEHQQPSNFRELIKHVTCQRKSEEIHLFKFQFRTDCSPVTGTFGPA